jgi:alkanesulfonate monooxygenase SsuD/methylene tetrahydromethanopterin reductase-like flavin-dependent oxidoreductase (luciferase family)
VIFGIGGGWNLEEMENHGTRPAVRWRILRERVLAMKQIWAEEEATYHGQFVNFDRIWSWPKPVQKPHPPILVGGDGPRTIDRIIEYGDEWMPIAGRSGNVLRERIKELQSRAKAAGRGPIPVSLFAAPPRQEMLEQLEVDGVTRAVFVIPPVPSEEAVSRLKRLAEVKAAMGG